MGDGSGTYHPVDAIRKGTTGLLIGGGLGLTAAAIRNALAKDNIGAMAVFRRGGHMITSTGGVGGILMFSQTVTANLLECNDWRSASVGGGLGGMAHGLFAKSIPKMFGYGFGFALIMGASQFTGGLAGTRPLNQPYNNEYERKEAMRKNRRRPIEDTLANIGEGRGIRPPGYEERRTHRLRERYGVEVQTVSAVARDSDTYTSLD